MKIHEDSWSMNKDSRWYQVGARSEEAEDGTNTNQHLQKSLLPCGPNAICNFAVSGGI